MLVKSTKTIYNNLHFSKELSSIKINKPKLKPDFRWRFCQFEFARILWPTSSVQWLTTDACIHGHQIAPTMGKLTWKLDRFSKIVNYLLWSLFPTKKFAFANKNYLESLPFFNSHKWLSKCLKVQKTRIFPNREFINSPNGQLFIYCSLFT